MYSQNTPITRTSEASALTNKVIRNTFILLALSFLFSAATAYFSLVTQAKPAGLLLTIVGMFGLSMLVHSLKNSAWGIAAIFAFTGFMGYILGPILGMYLSAYSNGAQLIATAMGTTGIIFVGLSAYALVTKKDYNYMGSYIFVIGLVAFIAGIGGIVFNIPMLNLAVSGVFALISSAYILFTMSNLINGGQTNYIEATISLYISIFNLFLSLLRILSFFAGNRN